MLNTSLLLIKVDIYLPYGSVHGVVVEAKAWVFSIHHLNYLHLIRLQLKNIK